MFTDNAEPTLREMLEDPIVRLRMKTARLHPEHVRECLVATRRRLEKATAAPARWPAKGKPAA